MGWQVIKQPNGKYCIWSSVVDNIVYYNGTREETINAFIKAEAETIQKRVEKIIDSIDSGGQPYHQFSKTFDDAIEAIKEYHGDDEAKKIIHLIDTNV